MSMMSDLSLLAENVREEVVSGSTVENAVDHVSNNSAHDREDIEWAYSSKYE